MTPEEEKAAKEILKRELTPVEYGMTDVMWSEHCSYKSSRPTLKLFPTTGPRVVVGPGYDAGVIDIGGGWCVAFKIESHNHPSAIEPYNGAATGIGGIIRDVLSMGARPVALLDSLRFGRLSNARNRWLLEYVVKGIADYGNCVGIPTVGGDTEFDDTFTTNCLVNVVCYGYVEREKILFGRAEHEGDLLILVGSSTGRDGIHGVTFASKILTDESDADRPAVQIGDPFTKKLLIECVLELHQKKLLRALKDLGGGGLTCVSSETTAKGGMGAEIDVAKVPRRETGMNAYEVMLSESQERMLLVVEPKNLERVRGVCEKYEVNCALIGKVRRGDLVIKEGEAVVARLPAKMLADAPLAARVAKEPEYIQQLACTKPPKEPSNLRIVLLDLLSSENIASKRWIYQQYDHEVGVRTVLKPGAADAAVLRAPNGKGIALKSDCNSSHCYLNPYAGGAESVLEAVRNITCVGAEPLAIVDNCNFGNPENPDVFWQFQESVRGMADACKFFNIPCVGGNVSFYNEDENKIAVKPAPVIAILGLVESLEHARVLSMKNADTLVLVGETRSEMGGSEYYEYFHKFTGGKTPEVNFETERRNARFVLEMIRKGSALCAHDCSKGGIGIALAELCIASGIGAKINLNDALGANECKQFDELLFSETNARYTLVTRSPEEILSAAKSAGIPAAKIGLAGGEKLAVTRDKKTLAWGLKELKDAWGKLM
ncbi:MAG: phosphoribosylformylglycinamidine synthase subunit PurL [Candidatus Micrarchaeota archaeon]